MAQQTFWEIVTKKIQAPFREIGRLLETVTDKGVRQFANRGWSWWKLLVGLVSILLVGVLAGIILT